MLKVCLTARAYSHQLENTFLACTAASPHKHYALGFVGKQQGTPCDFPLSGWDNILSLSCLLTCILKNEGTGWPSRKTHKSDFWSKRPRYHRALWWQGADTLAGWAGATCFFFSLLPAESSPASTNLGCLFHSTLLSLGSTGSSLFPPTVLSAESLCDQRTESHWSSHISPKVLSLVLCSCFMPEETRSLSAPQTQTEEPLEGEHQQVGWGLGNFWSLR